MSRFKVPTAPVPRPSSPKELFYELKRQPDLKFLWGPQEKMLEEYAPRHVSTKDLGIQLPTGAGKTLIGLLIAEYRRRAFDERAVFVCPTKQLCHQVARQATAYGINTVTLVGRQRNYDPIEFLDYQRNRTVAITTYSGIFNTNPKINDPEVLVFDDAHSAETFISGLWTVVVSSNDHPSVFSALTSILRPAIPSAMLQTLESRENDPYARGRVDLVSTIAAHPLLQQVSDLLDEQSAGHEFRFPWSWIGPHLEACSIYISPKAIEIKPVLSPALTHPPLAQAAQRIYMSATLGESGDLERSFGVKKIPRLTMPEEFEKRGTGRRFILLPGLIEGEEDGWTCALSIIRQEPRVLMLVPDNRRMEEVEDLVSEFFSVQKRADIEANLASFTQHVGPVALLLANQYHGIDLPGDDCRMQVIAGLPAGIGLQETYLMERLGAMSLLRDRIRTRITQALGRCTRDESDYAAVILMGEDLIKWIFTKVNVEGMHPELQAEIELGQSASKGDSCDEMLDQAVAFLGREDDWDEAEAFIVKTRNERVANKDDVSVALAEASASEIDYVYRLWDARYEDAFEHAVAVIDKLEGGVELRPYSSFWHHNAAVAAFLAFDATGEDQWRNASSSHLLNAMMTSSGLRWLPGLRRRLGGASVPAHGDDFPWQQWFMEISHLLEELRPKGRKFTRRMEEVGSNIRSTTADEFELGLEQLGRMLGARVHRWTETSAPDGFWSFDDWCGIVFEAKTDEAAEGPVSVSTVRQARTHIERVRSDGLLSDSVPCLTVLISPRERLHPDAIPHVEDIYWVSHDAVVSLFESAQTALTTVRSRAGNQSDERLLDTARAVYGEAGASPTQLRTQFEACPLRNLQK